MIIQAVAADTSGCFHRHVPTSNQFPGHSMHCYCPISSPKKKLKTHKWPTNPKHHTQT